MPPYNAIGCAYLQYGPAPGLYYSAGPSEIYARAIWLPGFRMGRNSGCRGFGCLRRFRRDFAFDKIAFLFLVLLVRAGVDILDAFHQSLVRRGLLIRYLRLLIYVVAFQHGFRNL